MVKVVVVLVGSVVLFFVEHFVEGVHAEQADPRYAQPLNDPVGHRGFPTG